MFAVLQRMSARCLRVTDARTSRMFRPGRHIEHEAIVGKAGSLPRAPSVSGSAVGLALDLM